MPDLCLICCSTMILSSQMAMLVKRRMEEMLLPHRQLLDASELFSLSKVVDLASASLQFKLCQRYFGILWMVS